MRSRPSLAAVSVTALLVSLSVQARAQPPAVDEGAPDPGEGALFGPLPPSPHSSPPLVEPGPRWRRVVFGVAAGGAGLALIGGLSLKVLESQKYREFNAFIAPESSDDAGDRCVKGTPSSGPSGCAELLADGARAHRWATIGFAAAGALAVTALIVKLTTPDASSEPPAPPPAPRRAARAPGLACGAGLASATCRLTF